PGVGHIKVPKVRRHRGTESEPAGPQRWRSLAEVALTAEQCPGRDRAALLEPDSRAEVARLQVRRILPPGAAVQPVAEPGPPELRRQAAGYQQRLGPFPLL